MSANPKFEQLPGVFCECSETPIRIALHELGPSHLYTLHVPPREFLHWCKEVRRLTNAPFAYQINIVDDPDLGSSDWYVSANGRALGSRGYG